MNFCKNPSCKNYGVPPLLGAKPKLGASTYRAAGAGAHLPTLRCLLCGESIPIKSNLAVVEELRRMSAERDLPVEPSCSTAGCINAAHPVSSKAHYQRFGQTAAGSPRFRCKACGKSVALQAKATLRQREDGKNRMIFSLLMNKSPMRRICEVADIHPKTLYHRIDFFYEQCRKFAAHYESRLLTDFKADRVYVAVDRQDYIMNWTNQESRRNVTLHGLASSDHRTGYVFGVHLDFDPAMDAAAVEADHKAKPELHLHHAFRRYARVWLRADYFDVVRRERRLAKRKERAIARAARSGTGVITDVSMRYEEAAVREDVEVTNAPSVDTQLPPNGMQVHPEYTLYAHFYFLEQMLRGFGKVRFFLDQESGIRAACLAAFQERIKNRTADAFYVRIDKGLTVNERRRAKAASDARFEKAKTRFPGKTDAEVQIEMIKERLAAMTAVGRWSDRWLLHPFPDMSEPDKAVCYLNDYGDYPPEHLARLYQLASLHSVDRFLMQVRRRISLLERPFTSASNTGRIWYGYCPYNPDVAARVLSIFRVFYNYVLVGEDGKTPAMRLGLMNRAAEIDDIISFLPPSLRAR